MEDILGRSIVMDMVTEKPAHHELLWHCCMAKETVSGRICIKPLLLLLLSGLTLASQALVATRTGQWPQQGSYCQVADVVFSQVGLGLKIRASGLV